jgi:hypothetical protein
MNTNSTVHQHRNTRPLHSATINAAFLGGRVTRRSAKHWQHSPSCRRLGPARLRLELPHLRAPRLRKRTTRRRKSYCPRQMMASLCLAVPHLHLAAYATCAWSPVHPGNIACQAQSGNMAIKTISAGSVPLCRAMPCPGFQRSSPPSTRSQLDK